MDFATRFNIDVLVPSIMTAVFFKDLYLLVFSFLDAKSLTTAACVSFCSVVVSFLFLFSFPS